MWHFYYHHYLERKGQFHLHFVISEGLDHFEIDLLTFYRNEWESLCKCYVLSTSFVWC